MKEIISNMLTMGFLIYLTENIVLCCALFCLGYSIYHFGNYGFTFRAVIIGLCSIASFISFHYLSLLLSNFYLI